MKIFCQPIRNPTYTRKYRPAYLPKPPIEKPNPSKKLDLKG